MREEVEALLALGPLPTENDARSVAPFEDALHAIQSPLSDDEAKALLALFGPDDCFGLAWTLLHLIETSPTPFPQERPDQNANPWHQLLYARSQ